jgi:hypothetical protein
MSPCVLGQGCEATSGMSPCVLGQGCQATNGMSPYGLWQGYEATSWGHAVCVATLDLVPFNELIFRLGILESTHLSN